MSSPVEALSGPCSVAAPAAVIQAPRRSAAPARDPRERPGRCRRVGTALPGGWTVYSLAITQDDCLEITIACGEETQIVLRLGSKTPGPFPVGGGSLSYQTTTVPFNQFLEAAKAVASALDRALAGRTISEMVKELR